MKKNSVALLAGSLVLLVSVIPSQAVQYRVTGLGNLGGTVSGGPSSWAYSIDRGGTRLVGQSSATSQTEAFRWDTPTGPMFGLGDLPGGLTYSSATGVDYFGNVVGNSYSSNGAEAFYYDATYKTMTGLGSLGTATSGGGTFGSWVYGLDWSGSYAVGRSNSPIGYVAFVAQKYPSYPTATWTMQYLGLNAPSVAYAADYMGDGKLYVAAQQGSQAYLVEKNYRWGPGTILTSLPDLPGGGTSSVAYGLLGTAYGNAKVVGYGSSSSGMEAAFWSGTVSGYTVKGLGDLPGGGFYSVAYGIDVYDQIVGTSSGAGGNEAFIWDKYRGMVSLNSRLDAASAGWRLMEARAIGMNSPGNIPTQFIVGTGFNPAGNLEGFLLTSVTLDEDGDGIPIMMDCDDTNPAIYPGAVEVCDGIDNNCWGIDEGFDQDSDGFTSCGGDCNDANAAVNPGATEICDTIDNNCSGSIDEGWDKDGDGYTTCGGDCNDGNAAVNPGAAEICDTLDNNCNGSIDEGFDSDADGFTTCGGDCNDARADSHPGGIEIVRDTFDQDCNGYDLTILVSTATWSKSKRTLSVVASSWIYDNANLTLSNFGPMVWNAKKKSWSKTVFGVDNPGTITVSGEEGSVATAVNVIK